MKPNWQKLASLAHAICTLWFQFFGAGFASKGYPFKEKNVCAHLATPITTKIVWFYRLLKSVSNTLVKQVLSQMRLTGALLPGSILFATGAV